MQEMHCLNQGNSYAPRFIPSSDAVAFRRRFEGRILSPMPHFICSRYDLSTSAIKKAEGRHRIGLCRNEKLNVRSPTTEQVKRPCEHYI
jgi:hypothetical protein